MQITDSQKLESTQQVALDEFEQELQAKTAILQQCQNDKSIKTCSMCESFIGCETRSAYVRAVYNSMSKGQQGSFDFN